MSVILTWATAHPTVSARGCGGSVERWHGCGEGVAKEQEGNGGGDPVGFADALQANAASEGRSVVVQLVGRPTAEAVGERPRCRPAHVLALPAWTFTLRAVVDVQRPARREAALGSEAGGGSAQRRVAVVPFISVADAEQLFAGIDEVGLDKPRSVVVHRARPPVTANPGKRDKLSCVFSRVLAGVSAYT
ncbi:hypothetical protein [Streptomyces hygroscopicus]|uniref:hypothetical protein n=1 Tax=Streptomyces hygroscopicus TaxID=1912 RepID=UPI00117DD62A|nr:hypothetical protein [Streptomyces hygroscopicus]MBW8093511.1 hypothetical protein [Streptomyces hygroscopicus subsp. hygroscopicus]